MKKSPDVDLQRLRSDVAAGLTARTLTRKYRISEEELAKLVSALVESGDLKSEDLSMLYSVSETIRALTWECPYCRKIVPASYDQCTRCGNARSH